MRTRIKICGITRARDGQDAARLGVDAIGLNRYVGSTRYVELEQARAIAAAVSCTRVAVFVDPSEAEVMQTLERVDLLVRIDPDEQGSLRGHENRPSLELQ